MSLVSVIVVSHNSSAYLSTCLASVEAQHGRESEIIVVDNASTDTTRALVREHFPRVRLLENAQNRGFATAVNQGLDRAKGRYVLLLNPDAMLLPSSVTTLVNFLETTPDAAAAGPRQWLSSEMTWQWSIVPRPPTWRLLLGNCLVFRRFGIAEQLLTEHWALNRTIWRRDQPCRVPFLSGACLLLRKRALDLVGGLDEGYFLFGEDIDLSVRLRSYGLLLFAVPQAATVHRGFHSVEMVPQEGRHHLTMSTARYLRLHESLLTRVIWSLVAPKRIRHTRYHRSEVLMEDCTTRPQAEITQETQRSWVEIGLEPLFLYVAAAEIDPSTLVLPPQLVEIARHQTLHVRAAPVDTNGQLGVFSPPRTLGTAECGKGAGP